MTHQDHIPAQGIPPHARLIQMITGTWVSGALVAAAKLNLADQLAGGPKSAADLAASMHVHASSLHRLMRTLASLGLLASRPDGRYELTALGEALKTGAPGAAKATVLSFGSDWFQSTWSQLSYSVETGETGFEKAHGMRLFDYLAQHPDDAARFSETMVGIHGQEPPAVAAAYDFSPFHLVADVGGATGNLLSAILAHHAGPRGVLFDLPHVVGEAPALLKQKGVDGRVTIAAGDFFKSVPEGADAYLLSHILRRLGRSAMPRHSGQCAQSHEANEPVADCGNGAARGRRAASRQNDRFVDACHDRRPGAERIRVSAAPG
jgi:hypothetical protein